MDHVKSIVIKLGSQTIVDANGKLDIAQLENLVGQMITLKEQGYHVILVSSGAVAAGRESTQGLSLKFQDMVEKRQIYASIGQVGLIETYNHILKKKGYIAAQILLTKEDFKKRSHYVNIYHLLHGLIQNKEVLPVINENDVTSIHEKMFTDNDELAALIAIQIHASKLIILTSVDGVYDKSPVDSDAKIISKLNLSEKAQWPAIDASKTVYGRGGMQSKLASAKKAAHFGIEVHIANARAPEVLLKAVKEKHTLGTTIESAKTVKGIKRWLAYSTASTLPSVIIHEGICELLLKKEKALSLLPVGILGLIGEFEQGDLVSIKNTAHEAIGVGIAAYDSRILAKVIKQKDQKLFMHYNKIYIF